MNDRSEKRKAGSRSRRNDDSCVTPKPGKPDLFGRRPCPICGGPMGPPVRADDRQFNSRKHCSSKCRQKAYRDRRRDA